MIDPNETAGLDAIARSLASMAESARRAVSAIEDRLAPALERIALAIETGGPPVGAGPEVDPGVSAVASIRLAIREGRWIEAEGLLLDLRAIKEGSEEAEALAREVSSGKEAATASARGRLDAARSAQDPAQIVESRDVLAALLAPAERSALDREVVRALMVILQKRLRAGKISAEVATLAATMSDRFAETAEGASLRAALPTLRRSAGLCPRCARPYRGIDDACPACLGRPEAPEEEEIPGPET